MKQIFIISIILFFNQINNAQNKITGKITDKENNAIEGVSVILPELNKSTISDKDGKYRLENLPQAKTKIIYTLLGYSNLIETVELNREDMELNVSLESTILKAEEVIISGGYHSTQHENAVKIDVLKLSSKDIKITPNFTEVLTKVPGIDMISKGSGVAKPVIRGLAMNDILVLNNGVRIENYQYSDHHPLGVDEFGIDDVEIIKGPASLLYGSDAIGGVINFIKEKPAPVGNILGDYNIQMFSNTNGMTNNLGIKGASGNFFGGLRAGHKTNEDFLQGEGDYVPNSRFKSYTIQANAGYTGKKGTARLYYDRIRMNLGLVEDEAIKEIKERGREPMLFYQRINSDILSSQNKLFLGKTKIDINAAYQATELAHFGEPDVYELEMGLKTLTYEARLYLPSDANSNYIIGFQGLNQKNSNINERETILLPDAEIFNYSAFGLVQKTIVEKIKLQAGLRFDEKQITTEEVQASASSGFRPGIDKNYNSFSGSLGATYNISEALLIRSNVAAAFRTPTLAELTSDGQHETRYEKGDAMLSPEKSTEADMSMHLHKKHFTFDIAGFYNMIDDFIFIAPTGDSSQTGLNIYKYKQHNSYLYGCEAGVHFHPSSLEWLHLEITYAAVRGKQKNGENLPFIPADKLKFDLRCEFGAIKKLYLDDIFISFNSQFVFKQDKSATEEMPTDAYTLFDIATGAKINFNKQPLIISLSINNLFDIKYIDHLSTLKETGFYNSGRNIVLSLRIPFIINF